MMYKVPPGNISANNYGRGHMKLSHQVSYDMRLPPYKKIPVKNDKHIQGTPWLNLKLLKLAIKRMGNLERIKKFYLQYGSIGDSA